MCKVGGIGEPLTRGVCVRGNGSHADYRTRLPKPWLATTYMLDVCVLDCVQSPVAIGWADLLI